VTRIGAEGISVDLPSGWDGRVFRRTAPAPETTHAVMHAASFALPVDAADYGDGAVQLMGDTDVFMALVEFHPDSTATPLFSAQGRPAPFQARDASTTTLQRAVGGQAGIQRFFSEADRAWSLYVVLGRADQPAALVDEANGVISTIRITQ